ncbi:M48 family metalloprotease [Streptomyces sp. NPDC051018]|uniref:M48 family metalloprotease n=1 Tax=Streptomyces sp. NPDC051018 TaxID=3365639 RepID=UPI00379AFCA0
MVPEPPPAARASLPATRAWLRAARGTLRAARARATALGTPAPAPAPAPETRTPATETGEAARARRELAEALTSSRLPQPTTTRLLLLVLVAASGASFAAWWWLIRGRGNWRGGQLACVPEASAGVDDPAELVTAFTSCIDGVRLAQAAVVLCGPLALLVLAIAVRAASRRWTLSRTAPADPEMLARLGEALPEGAPRVPELVVDHRRPTGTDARASGTVRRPRIIVDGGAYAESERDIRTMLRHELAHLEARDVGRVRLALSAWWVLLAGVTLPLLAALALRPGLLAPAVGVRMTAIVAVFGLILCGVLRVREYDADVRASADPRDPGGMAAYIGRTGPLTAGKRLLYALGLATHPTGRARLAMLARPGRLWGFSPFEALATGIAAGLVLTDLALLVAALTPDSIVVGHRIAGALTGWAIAGVVTVALWRAAAVGHPDARGLRPARAGAALGAGILAGTQLSARAAGDWQLDTVTADGLTSSFSLLSVSTGRIVVLTALLVLGGAAFGHWAAALARATGATVAGRWSAPACAAAVALSGLVLAVPLGTWFTLAVVAANGGDAIGLWAVIDNPGWMTATTLSLVAAIAPFTAAALRPSRRRTRPARATALAVPVLVAAVGLLLAQPYEVSRRQNAFPVGGGDPDDKGGSVLRRPVTPPPDGAPVPIRDLPVLPPHDAEGSAPVTDPFLVCRALERGGNALWVDEEGRREAGELLAGVDDPVLRAVSVTLLGSGPERVETEVIQAAAARCDLLFRYDH